MKTLELTEDLTEIVDAEPLRCALHGCSREASWMVQAFPKDAGCSHNPDWEPLCQGCKQCVEAEHEAGERFFCAVCESDIIRFEFRPI